MVLEHKTEDLSKFLNPGEFIKNGKRYVRVVTHDSVRDLIIPNPNANLNTAVYCPEELKELSNRKNLGTENVTAFSKNLKEERENEARKAAFRKKELQSYPIYKEYGPRLNKLEQEAEAKANFLLNRAKEIREEDNDKIKLCNKLILSTKCHAIRDAQVAEKQTIQKELQEEERRLDMMMEQERKRMLAKEMLDKSGDHEKKEAYKKAITEQVQGKILEREMEAERLIEEMKILNETAIQGQINELQLMQKKAEQQKKMREDLNRINQTMIERADKERNQAKLADLKIQEFMRQKAELEDMREKELLAAKTEREKELTKLRAMQQKAQDRESEKDALRAKRRQEEVEREWREKEKRVKEEKQMKMDKLKQERMRQIEEKKRTQAIEAERERQENLRLQAVEQQIEKKEQEEENKRKQGLEKYKASLLKQINEKEYERIKMRKATYEEGISAAIERRNHEDFLKSIIKKKLNAIRVNNVPEKYVEEIEKRLNIN
ncbi:cilia- and flagella-associated protein 45-like [Cimex lectularius]|uniref:Cilia- and flagella-associated protein 45 n=1 Tax=Cimex lectularius TaxID=79782 RepID=A0A8I6RU72_CIMLE|nr:cilia- and flagella-associated protein 45-like [Cimex lectularius]